MKIAAVKRTDKKAYSENGRLQLWEAEFLLDSCQAEQAIKIGWRLANNSRLKDQALDLLTQVYQRSGDYAGLRKVAHAYRNAGYAYEYYRLQVMLIIYEISTLDPRRDQIKIGKLEEKMRFYGTQFIESVELQRAENFTTAANYLQQIEQILFTSGFVQPELFQSLLGSIPPGAERLRLYADKLVAFQVMHQAGASGRALEFHGYQLQYLPLNEFNPPLLPTYHEGSDFEEIMLTPDRREAPYYVADSDRLHEILETGYTTLAAEAGVEVPEVRDLSDLSMPEALRFLARISEDIVWQYAEDPAADFACLPLEERISRDYFNQAVCRHYTIIFLALFNELKKHNAHLQGYHAISDFSPLHTFPTVFTVQGRQVYFTSLDPTADDATPAFGDKLAASPTEHFQLNEFVAAEVKAKRYDAALARIRGNLAQIQDNPYEVIISYRSILEVHTLKGSEVPAYQQLEAEIEQYQAAHPLQEETAPAFCYLRLILAKVKDKLGKSDQAQALLKKLLGDPTFPAPVRTELESAYIAIIAKREDGGGAELEKIIRSRGSLAVYGKVAARGSAEAQIEHPLFSRLVPGTRVVIRLNGDRFYARVYKGQVQLPGELKPYKNELTGYELEIVISRPRRLKTFHPADTE